MLFAAAVQLHTCFSKEFYRVRATHPAAAVQLPKYEVCAKLPEIAINPELERACPIWDR
jgi:hypothetical protein